MSRPTQKEIYELAKSKGWHPEADQDDALTIDLILSKVALIHSELSEAVEELRMGRARLWYDDKKPEGFGVEIADAVIRCYDLAGMLNIDLDKMIELKHNYNTTRSARHGGKLA